MPTDAEKREILNDGFVYEVQMIFIPMQMTAAVRSKVENEILSNMRIESPLLHTRVLLEFFRTKRGHRDTAIASDFLKVGETWKNIDFSKYPNLRQVRDRADKEVAHLSYGRVRQAKSKWNLNALLIELSEIINEFVPKCDEKYIDDRLINLMSDFNRQVSFLRK